MYEAIRALEQVGVLSWVNRIKRVREYVPRPVRQPGATTLRGAGSPAALPVAWALARLAGKAASAANGQNQTARTAAPATRCNDVARIGQFRRLTGSMSFETTPLGALWASANRRSSSRRTSAKFASNSGARENSPPNQRLG